MPSLAAIGSSASYLQPLRREAGRPPPPGIGAPDTCARGAQTTAAASRSGAWPSRVEQLVAEWVIRPLSGPALSAATEEDRAERELLDRCRSTRTGWRRAAACT